MQRRVRKDPIEEEKCEAVAALLMEGKVGKRLETEIKQVIAEKVAADPGRVELAPLATKRGRRSVQSRTQIHGTTLSCMPSSLPL
jgi:hypothetical protein